MDHSTLKKRRMWRSLCTPLKLGLRSFTSGSVCQAGSLWRLKHGLSRSGTEYGPMTDQPDWSFADGRAAPPMKGQQRRRQEAALKAGRVLMLTNELQRGMERWEGQQSALHRQREEERASQLQPKGARTKAPPPTTNPSK
ncbi:large ribosomal subunit protein mL52 isoform X2 [Rhinoraja longicauda]